MNEDRPCPSCKGPTIRLAAGIGYTVSTGGHAKVIAGVVDYCHKCKLVAGGDPGSIVEEMGIFRHVDSNGQLEVPCEVKLEQPGNARGGWEPA